MPIAGHDYGVDSGSQLRQLNWQAIQQQRNANPTFAGRYFNPHVSVTWVNGEANNVKQSNPNLSYVFPMQNPGGRGQTNRVEGLHYIVVILGAPPAGPNAARATAGAVNLSPTGAITGIAVANGGGGYAAAPAVRIFSGAGSGAAATATVANGAVTRINVTAGGSGYKQDGSVADSNTVQAWGDTDAKETCGRISDRVNAKELLYPSPKSVYVYLDIEAGVAMSPDYWYGWASKVYWFGTGFFEWPFYPCLYCTTIHNPTDTGNDPNLHRIPSGDVQNGLTAPPNSFPSRCWGIFASNPQVPPDPSVARYAPNFQPDWQNRFDEWTQTVHVIFGLFPWKTVVRVLLWQYAMQSLPGPGNAHPSPAAFNALRVDLDETSPSGEAIPNMLKLP